MSTRLLDGELWGHPNGLYVLFFTEMWERFSYYGMRALLVFYMTKQLLYSHGQASQIYGLYTGLVYFTPLLGGLLADRVVGQRKTVILGGILMAIGHFLMAFENLFFPALGFLILGNGAFKPNISAQVGNLYPPGDRRRDRAFSIFYVGINLGAFLSPLVCGTLGEIYGWHYGFAVAGVGMLIGLFIYILGRRWLAPDLKTKAKEDTSINQPLTRDDKHRLGGLGIIALVGIVFWASYEQMGNTIALWADEDTDRRILGWEVPASWFQSLNPFCIFLFTPLITSLWAWQARRGKEPTSAAKIAAGCLLLGAAYLIMVPAARIYAVNGTPVSMLWTIAFIVVLTLGELFLSPVGLSLFSKLAPARMVSMLIGVWFLAQFAGNYLAGFLGRYWEIMPKGVFFLLIAGIPLAAGLLLFLALKPLQKALTTRKG